MFTQNPVVVVISFISAVVFCFTLFECKKMVKSLIYSFIIMALIAIINPLFSHKGQTILFYVFDNPITKESLCYGGFISVMLFAVVYWCKAYSLIMGGDKILFLFGKRFPKISILLAMVFRLVPKINRQYHEIDDCGKALGIYATKSYFDRLKSKMRTISILVTCSLENSIQTADSMNSRGFALKNKSGFGIFKWTKFDSILVSVISVLFGFSLYFILNGNFDFSFYPQITIISFRTVELIADITILLLMILPTIIKFKEVCVWHCLKSRI